MRTAETDLQEIKKLMERSSRFISLSGLSGVFAGIYALIGAWVAHLQLLRIESSDSLLPLVITAVSVLTASIITAIFLTTRNARRKNQKIWDKLSQRLLWNLSIPLLAGGLFLLILIGQQQFELVVPIMLIFYGLGLINGSKYTLDDIRYLGYLEIILGLMATWFQGYGLIWWALGFGLLHIVYGTWMYWKHER